MPRPKKTDVPDLAERIHFTAGVIERLACPPGKQQAFMRDTEAPALRVRCTAAGAKAYVFEAKLEGKTIRRTIGDVRSHSIEQARNAARRLSVLIDQGIDPREQDRERREQKAVAQAAAAVQAVTVGEAWAAYCAERAPHWGERHRFDHQQLSKAGGEPAKRGVKPSRPGAKPVTVSGPLYPLLALKLSDLTPCLLYTSDAADE